MLETLTNISTTIVGLIYKEFFVSCFDWLMIIIDTYKKKCDIDLAKIEIIKWRNSKIPGEISPQELLEIKRLNLSLWKLVVILISNPFGFSKYIKIYFENRKFIHHNKFSKA